MQNIKQLARQMKALSNENRLAIYLQLLEHEQTASNDTLQAYSVYEIATQLKICAPTISHHIKTLEAANLIDVQKQGKFIFARINKQTLERAMNAFRVCPFENN